MNNGYTSAKSCTRPYFSETMAAEALKELEDQLNCLICLDIYTTPKLLQCNHVFCQGCLARLPADRDQQGQLILTCPTCRQVTPLPAGVRGLQSAFLVNKFLEVINNQKQSTEDTFHCLEHQNRELELYCETCDKLICLDCTIRQHNGHMYSLVKDVFEKHRLDIISSLKPADKQLNSVSTALEELTARYGEIFDQQSTLESQIHQRANELHKTIENSKNELISKLHHITREKLIDLASQREQMETIQAQLRSCIDYMKERLRTESQVKVLKMKTTRVTEVQELTATFLPETLTPNAEADIEFSSPQDIATACRNFGQIYTLSSPSSSKCYTMCEKEAVIEGKSTTILQAINFKGEPYVKQLETLKCELVSEITGIRARGSAEKRGESQYEISYQPTVKGRHQLHITIDGWHIRGSPFSITAKTPVEMLGVPLLTIGNVQRPWGVAINHRGEVVITEHNGHCISVFTPSGNKLRSFGMRGSGQGQFKNPCGVAIDSEENILVVDNNNHRIQKFTPEGEFMMAVGEKVVIGPQNFDYFQSIALNTRNNRIYVVNGCSIQILNSDLTCFSTFGKNGSGKGQFDYPWGIACDSTGKVYVADSANHRIQVFTTEGKFLRQFGRRGQGTGELYWPYGIAIDANNTVYISEFYNHRISVFTPDGKFLTSFGSFGEEPGEFKYPYSLAVDHSGVVYMCDYGNNRAQVF